MILMNKSTQFTDRPQIPTIDNRRCFCIFRSHFDIVLNLGEIFLFKMIPTTIIGTVDGEPFETSKEAKLIRNGLNGFGHLNGFP